MTGTPQRKDLIVLAADKQIEFTLRGLLPRCEALGIRHLQFDVFVHSERDPGCYNRSDQFLRPFANRYAHALVIFDRKGCGRETEGRDELERHVEDRLSRAGWGGRASAIVLDPELEIWLWSDSPNVGDVLGWRDHEPGLNNWLSEQGFRHAGQAKPEQPKQAMNEALKTVGKPRSSALYEKLAQAVSLRRCTDPAFRKFRQTIHGWFGAD